MWKNPRKDEVFNAKLRGTTNSGHCNLEDLIYLILHFPAKLQ